VGLPVVVRPVDVDESRREAEGALAYLRRVTRLKLVAAAAQVAEASVVLVADTIVVVDGDVLGKPVDRADAARLLARITGREHVVATRYAIGVAPGVDVPRVERTVESRVAMRSASPDEIQRYAATGEGLDKAGAYAVQGIGAFLVRAVRGSYTNVVGLPVCEVVEDLKALGALGPFP
jgi:septum formation protein